MNHDILFWYTGAIVWWIISGIVSLSILAGLIAGVFVGFTATRRWIGLKIIFKSISKSEHVAITETIPRVNDADAKVIHEWLERFYENISEVNDETKNEK